MEECFGGFENREYRDQQIIIKDYRKFSFGIYLLFLFYNKFRTNY
jgi:hypothetical protein